MIIKISKYSFLGIVGFCKKHASQISGYDLTLAKSPAKSPEMCDAL